MAMRQPLPSVVLSRRAKIALAVVGIIIVALIMIANFAGVYVNYLGTEGEERVRAAYGVNHARLREVKRKYDPHNFFRLNQNIEPAAT